MKNKHQERPSGRNPYVFQIMAILLVVLLSACSSGLTVRSEIDPGANFSQYRTYNFFDPMGIEGGYNSPIFGEHYRAAIGGEMARRKYQTADVPDLLINVTIRSDDKVKMRSYTRPYATGAYYGRPGGAYGGSALGVGISSGSRATKTTEASVFIDLVDFRQQRVVWQGVAVIDVNDKVASQLRDAIFTSVNKVMAEYPHTAGR
ncbi:MAG: DUF4136 domain-containing protein [Gammaproteobacteria bacterium]|nr:DUF4136 domain-containing protein [Gammaproteobacteria bacterium]